MTEIIYEYRFLISIILLFIVALILYRTPEGK